MSRQVATLPDMRAVGVRELRNNLSEYLRAVKAGDRVLITDRGQVIAELRPPAVDAELLKVPPALARLIRKRTVIGLRNQATAYPRMPRRVPDGTANRILDELRGDR